MKRAGVTSPPLMTGRIRRLPKGGGVIEKFRQFLPVSGKTPVVTLQEGDTPLVRADRLAAALGLAGASVFLKLEGLNPTGSFKDRGMTLAVSKALEEGAGAVVCASTGNTAASASAYAARAGLRCVVLLPEKSVAAGKLAQALVHGAEVVSVKGNFDRALELVKLLSRNQGLTIVNSLNPYRLEGQKTAAFEIVASLGRMPTHQFMPVGNAGNITAYWKGYREILVNPGVPGVDESIRRRGELPRMMGFQAEGAAPIVLGRRVENPRTVASAIRIGNPVSWKGAVCARDESQGQVGVVSDSEILDAYRLIAVTEGIFCEPASAAGVAGLAKWAKTAKQSPARRAGTLGAPEARRACEGGADAARHQIPPAHIEAVCILTGNGLKDPELPMKMKFKIRTVSADIRSLEKCLGSRRL